MVVYYELFGRKVGSHVVRLPRGSISSDLANWQLSMITLGTLFGGAYLSTRGGDKKAEQGPPIAASSKDEEQFIQYV